MIPPGYTRVSEILQIFQAYAFVDREKLKKAQDVGVEVHAAIAAYFNDKFAPLDRKRNGYFESFLKWVESVDVKPIYIEERFYDHPLRLTGQVDLLAEIAGVNVLVDFKTGSWSHPEIWRLQGAFYRMMIPERYTPNHYMFVQLMRDGSKPILFPITHREEDSQILLDAVRCYKWFQKQKTPVGQTGELTQ